MTEHGDSPLKPNGPSAGQMIIVSLGAALLSAVVGLIAGAMFGDDTFTFAGRRGYEATGVIGFWIGLAAGGTFAPIILYFRSRARS